MKPLVFQEIGNGLNGKSQAKLSNLVNSYYKLTIWWLEMNECNSIFEFERMATVSYAQKRKPHRSEASLSRDKMVMSHYLPEEKTWLFSFKIKLVACKSCRP